jgi:hypothetical protein
MIAAQKRINRPAASADLLNNHFDIEICQYLFSDHLHTQDGDTNALLHSIKNP